MYFHFHSNFFLPCWRWMKMVKRSWIFIIHTYTELYLLGVRGLTHCLKCMTVDLLTPSSQIMSINSFGGSTLMVSSPTANVHIWSCGHAGHLYPGIQNSNWPVSIWQIQSYAYRLIFTAFRLNMQMFRVNMYTLHVQVRSWEMATMRLIVQYQTDVIMHVQTRGVHGTFHGNGISMGMGIVFE